MFEKNPKYTMKNFHQLVNQEIITVELTKDELHCLQNFLDEYVSMFKRPSLQLGTHKDVINALYKLGMVNVKDIV
jgi:hypothetical protein